MGNTELLNTSSKLHFFGFMILNQFKLVELSSLYISVREGRTYIKKYLDSDKGVYELSRTYCHSVANPDYCDC